ncbi:uncharacterized protein LOC122856928 isoform X2 [Aphidius gifuensis]|uniref:uncharacterized protein LOC122856928 isoform X2 n=1 Tax=Aphidius gifuensis TaxID=684658 RepID=UPI001CDCA25C|nr:uncharacterized protein LOC122856928 isoform X2 [Aphidius gifuensis]
MQKYFEELIEANYPNLPKTLVPLTTGITLPGDCGRNADDIPDWLDHDKFLKGQRFAMDNLFGISFAEMLSLFVLYSFEEGLKPIIMTQNSSKPYEAFKRFLSTGNRVRNWYTSDIWKKGTPGYNDIEIVRKMHGNVRNRLEKLTKNEIDNAAKIIPALSKKTNITIDDFRDCCEAPKIGQCPFTSDAYRLNKIKGLNQTEMSITHWAFIGFTISYPEYFGIHDAKDEDLDAFCHMWRGIGYRLGIDDKYNFCQGSLTEIRDRSNDLLEFWAKPLFRNVTPEWEHMMRCLIEGIGYYTPGLDYDTSLFYLCNILNCKMPRFQSSMSLLSYAKYRLTKTLFLYLFRIPGIRNYMNEKVIRNVDAANNYDENKHAELQKKSTKSMNT